MIVSRFCGCSGGMTFAQQGEPNESSDAKAYAGTSADNRRHLLLSECWSVDFGQSTVHRTGRSVLQWFMKVRLSALLAVAGVLLYRFTMEPLGVLLQRRERDILLVVTQEIG